MPCLHFEAAYYQPLEFCIEQGIATFEGGAQGEHKMARGFLPTQDLVGALAGASGVCRCRGALPGAGSGGIDDYIDELNERSPFRSQP